MGEIISFQVSRPKIGILNWESKGMCSCYSEMCTLELGKKKQSLFLLSSTDI